MPNPHCRWCHGTGQIALFLSIVPCECAAARAETPKPSWLPPSLRLDPHGPTFTGPLGAAYCVRPTNPPPATSLCPGAEMYLAELIRPWTAPGLPPLDQLGVPPVGAACPGAAHAGLRLHAARRLGFLGDALPHVQHRLHLFELVWRR